MSNAVFIRHEGARGQGLHRERVLGWHGWLIVALLLPGTLGLIRGAPAPRETAPTTPVHTPPSSPSPTVTETPFPADPATATETAPPAMTVPVSFTDTLPTTLTPAVVATVTPTATPESPSAELDFELRVEPAHVSAGEPVTFTAVLVNHGPELLSGAVFSDDLPAGFVFQPAASPDVRLDPQERWVWTPLPDLAPGASVRVRYVLRAQGPGRFAETWVSNAARIFVSTTTLHASGDLLWVAPGVSGERVTAKGGQAHSADGRVAVHIPAGAWGASDGVVVFSPRQDARGEGYSVQLDLRTIAGSNRDGQGNVMDAVRELTATAASFTQPVVVQFTLEGFADLNHVPPNESPYVVTYDAVHQVWIRLPHVAVDAVHNTLTVETTHFSAWAAGIGPNTQAVLFRDPGPALFTGAATLNTPLWTPPGAGGLQPTLALQYTSSAVDGLLSDVQAGWVGLGWSVTGIEIVRTITNGACQPCGDGATQGASYGYRNEFVLLLNGVGYPLQVDPTSPARYFTRNQSFLYLERHNAMLHNGGSPSNVTHEWWEVKTTDGTVYQLGFTADAEQVVTMKGYTPALTGGWSLLGYAGAANDVVANRWSVDRVVDVDGNTLTYTYDTVTRQVTVDSVPILYDQAQYLKQIAYSGYTVDFQRESRHGYDEAPTASDLQNWSQWETEKLVTITVRSVITTPNDVRRYVLEYLDTTDPDTHQTLRLTGLTEQGVTADGTVTRLPRMTFTYTHLADRGGCTSWNDCKGWAYPRLTSLTNGYGGVVTYTYGHDGRSNDQWLSYRVETMTVSDGSPGARPAITTYAYAGLAYTGQAQAAFHGCDIPDNANPPNCYGLNIPGWVTSTTLADWCWLSSSQLGAGTRQCKFLATGGGYQVFTYYALGYNANQTHWSYTPDEGAGSVLGYGTVTETVWGEGQPAATTVHQFHTRSAWPVLPDTATYLHPVESAPLAGREYTLQHRDAQNRPFDTTDTAYTDYTTTLWGNDIHFVYASAITQSVWSANGNHLAFLDRTLITYTWASGVPNQRQVEEYDSNNQPYRQTREGYFPNTTVWLINLPAYQNVFRVKEGTETCGGTLAGWCLIHTTQNLYDTDGDTDYGEIAQTPHVIVQRRGVYDPAGSTYVDTQFEYDPWGNLITTTLYNTYAITPSLGNTATNPITSVVGYDAGHRFPVTQTNALGQSVYTQYEDRLAVPVVMTDANHIPTTFQYDALGRPTDLYRWGDPTGDPSGRRTYWDVGSATWMNPTLRVERQKPVSFPNAQTRHFEDGLGREIQTHTGISVSVSGASGGYDVVVSRGYDALGRLVSETVPYTVTPYTYNPAVTPYTTTGLLTAPATRTQYDALNRPVRVTAPDGTASSLVYANGSAGHYLTRVDANGHYRFQVTDAFGRLTRVDETLATLEDPLTQIRSTVWVTTSQQSLDAGTLKNTAGGGLYRQGGFTLNGGAGLAGVTGQGIQVDFKVDQADAAAVLALSASTNNFQRFGVLVGGGQLSVQYNASPTTFAPTTVDLLAPLEPNVWYVLTLKTSPTGWVYIEVWRKDDPSQHGASGGFTLGAAGYRFYTATTTGTIWLDNYQERDYSTTVYTYNALDQLTQVKDPLSNTTVISYNTLGQKVAMTDPDMGTWTYQYDAAGRLITQTDTLHPPLLFSYDALGRLTQKRSGGTVLATYTYDAGANGIGHRTGMTDTVGFSTWAYDPRGRLLTETQTLTAAGTFTTSYGYDALDRVLTTTYPTGEVVTQTYNTQGLLENVRSLSHTQWLASNLDYNANGALALLQFGNGASTTYGYFGLNGNPWDVRPGDSVSTPTLPYGRLWRLRTEGPPGATLQDLQYAYDRVGNVVTRYEAPRALSAPLTSTLSDPFTILQTGVWTYTTQSLVTDATAPSAPTVVHTVGNGTAWVDFARQHTLGTGRGLQVNFKVLTTTAVFVLGLQVDDGSPTPPRLALDADGSGTLRVQYSDGYGWRYPLALPPTVAVNTWYTLTLTVDDRRGPTLELYNAATANARLTYNIGLPSGQRWRFHAWTWTGTVSLDNYREFTQTVAYVPDDWQGFTYDSLNRLTSVYTHPVMTQGYSATYTYNALGNLLSKAEPITQAWTYTYSAAANGRTQPHAATAAGSNTYQYDGNGNMTQRIESGVTYSQTYTAENMLSGVTNTTATPPFVTKFYYNGDNTRVKKEELSGTTVLTTTLYAGSVEVVITATARLTKTYYAAGAQLVALRVMTGTGTGTLYFLHTDHLGSTSLATNNTGGVVARQSYYAYGTPRNPQGALPTDRTFTGKRADSYIKLDDMGARWYDADLGRFISADSIVPQAGNPQTLNRYSYALSNPIKNTDPTGHAATCADCGGNSLEQTLDYFRRYGKYKDHFNDYYATVYFAEEALAESVHDGLTQSEAQLLLAYEGAIENEHTKAINSLPQETFSMGMVTTRRTPLTVRAAKMGVEFLPDVPKADRERGIWMGVVAAPTFAEGFSAGEQAVIRLAANLTGRDVSSITFSRMIGAPSYYPIGALPGQMEIAVGDGFFALSVNQQVEFLHEEINHVYQSIEGGIGAEDVRRLEDDAKRTP